MGEVLQRDYHKIFTVYWKILKKYSDLSGGDEFWLNAIHDAEAAHAELQDINADLSQKMATGVLRALQDEYRKVNANG